MDMNNFLIFAQKWDIVDDCLRAWYRENKKYETGKYDGFVIFLRTKTPSIVIYEYNEPDRYEIELTFEDFVDFYTNVWKED